VGDAGRSLGVQKSFLGSICGELTLQATHSGDHSIDISKNIFL
jgi:hypothetical protein